MNAMYDETIYKLQQEEFSGLLGLKQLVSLEVLGAAVRNTEYYHNLTICKDNPEYLKYLLMHPDVTGGMPSKEEIDKFIHLKRAERESEERKKHYNQVYGNYIKLENNNKEGKCRSGVEIPVHDFREVYLDNNATTKLRPEVQQILLDYANGRYGYGNPGNTNGPGYLAADYVTDARLRVAKCLGVTPDTIYFTGSGSEANNLAIKGIAFQHFENKGQIITTKVEHKAVLEVMDYLEKLGFTITRLDVDFLGRVDPKAISEAICEKTILVSVMAANNEIGTIQPIEKIGLICKEAKVPFMTDAIQAFGKLHIDPKSMGISILTFSGHKLYGPKGIGGIYVEKGLHLVPLIHGGGQEAGLRSGTENVGYIIAVGRAAELSYLNLETERKRMEELQRYFLKKLEEIEPEYRLNGPDIGKRLPNNLSIAFPDVDSRALQKSLSKIGISVSISSACSAKITKESYVLQTIGIDSTKYATIRFGFGLDTNKEDIDYLFEYLGGILVQLRETQSYEEKNVNSVVDNV